MRIETDTYILLMRMVAKDQIESHTCHIFIIIIQKDWFSAMHILKLMLIIFVVFETCSIIVAASKNKLFKILCILHY